MKHLALIALCAICLSLGGQVAYGALDSIGVFSTGASSTGANGVRIWGRGSSFVGKEQGTLDSLKVYLDFIQNDVEVGNYSARGAIYVANQDIDTMWCLDSTASRSISYNTTADKFYGFDFITGATIYADTNYCLAFKVNVDGVNVINLRYESVAGDSLRNIGSMGAWACPTSGGSVQTSRKLSIYVTYNEAASGAVNGRRRVLLMKTNALVMDAVGTFAGGRNWDEIPR